MATNRIPLRTSGTPWRFELKMAVGVFLPTAIEWYLFSRSRRTAGAA